MMLKALLLVHFWSILLLEEQMLTSVRKMLKTLVWSAQNQSSSKDICPEKPQNWPFFGDFYSVNFALKIPAESADFFMNLSLKIL